jgi:hypothetical protein
MRQTSTGPAAAQKLTANSASSALSQAKVRVESLAGKRGQVPKMHSTLRAVPVFGT